MIIDTNLKTVTPQGENLGDIIAGLKAMFPGGEWKEYTISPQVITVDKWYPNPILPSIPYTPWYQQPYPVIVEPSIPVPYVTWSVTNTTVN